MNKYFLDGFEKVAKKKKDNPSAVKTFALGSGGAWAVNKSVDPLTGRVTVYHGTSPEKYKKIMKEGLDPAKGGTGAGAAVGNPHFIENSKGKVHVTRSKLIARSFTNPQRYYMGATKGEHKGKAVLDLLNPTNNKGIVRASIPQHRYDKFIVDMDMGGNKRLAATTSEKIEPSLLKGGKGYYKRRIKDLKHIPSYVMEHHKRFLGGVGLAGLGSYGIYKAYKNLKKKYS